MRKSMTRGGGTERGGMMPNVTDVVMTKARAVKTMEAAVETMGAVETMEAAVEAAAVAAAAVAAAAVAASEAPGIHWSRHHN